MREYLLVLLIAVAVTYLASGLARRFAFRYNAVAQVRERDVHTRPVPYFGGPAMLAGLWAAILVAFQLPWLGGFDVVFHDGLAILVASTVICLVGVLDDVMELGALAKTAGEMLAAGIVVMNGVRIYWIPLPETIISLDAVTSVILTLVLVFVCTNAINFVDGLDGLAAGIVAIGSGAFFLYSYLLSYEQDLVRATTASLITVATVGVAIGFLPHNIHKARMFMGDSGALLLGFLMATSVISLTGQIDPSRIVGEETGLLMAYLPILLPLAVLALPVLDLGMAFVRRSWAGQAFYRADKQHLHHRMLKMGHSHRVAVFLMWFWAGLLAFGAVGIGVTGSWVAWAFLILGLLVAAFLTSRPIDRWLK